MGKIGVFYGSSTGNTEDAAKAIAKLLDADVHDVSECSADVASNYEVLVLGSSTLGIGDLQDDWDDFLPALADTDLSGKKIAIFGLGDADGYPDSFVDAMGTIYNALKDKQCDMIARVSTDGYEYDESAAEDAGEFVGLPLDEDNQSELSDERIEAWVASIKREIA